MDRRQAYLDTLTELARRERVASLEIVLDARLAGEREVSILSPAGAIVLVAPTLDRDEPELASILYDLSNALAREGGPALETLRRAAIDLLFDGLNSQRDMAHLKAVARLVGHARAGEDAPLACGLRQRLHGYLATSLRVPFEDLLQLDGDELARATLAVDILLVATPVMPAWPKHHVARVNSLVDNGLTSLAAALANIAARGANLVTASDNIAARFDLLLLAYRLAIKLTPESAGNRLWQLLKIVTTGLSAVPAIHRRWLAWCQHQGLVMARHRSWAERFKAGAEATLSSGVRADARDVVSQSVVSQSVWMLRLNDLVDDERLIGVDNCEHAPVTC